MRIITAIMVCALAIFVVSLSFDTPAEARKIKASKSIGKSFGKSMSRASKGMSRSVRKVGRGVSRSVSWGASGLLPGAALVTGTRARNNCNHYYKRYRETGNAKWRNKYNNCIR